MRVSIRGACLVAAGLLLLLPLLLVAAQAQDLQAANSFSIGSAASDDDSSNAAHPSWHDGIPASGADSDAFIASWGSGDGGNQEAERQQRRPPIPLPAGRSLLAAAAASTGEAINGLTFVAAAGPSSSPPSCPPPVIAGSTQSLINTNIKRGAVGSSELYACVSTGATGPFIASLQLTAPGGSCPAGTTQLPTDLNAPAPGAPRVLACVATTGDAARALRALRVAFADRGSGGAKCGAGLTQVDGDANAGVPGALSAYFCVTHRDQGMIPAAQNPLAAATGTSTTLLMHPLSEGLDSCLTIGGGAAKASAVGMRVTPWPCIGGAPAPQQWVFVPKGGDRWVRWGRLSSWIVFWRGGARGGCL